MSHRLTLVLAVLAVALGAAAPAQAARDLAFSGTAGAAKARSCHGAMLPAGRTVVRREATASATGLLRATSRGAGDWDLAVFDADTGRLVGAGAGPDGREVVTGFVHAGERLVVQACRFDGGAGRLRVTVDSIAMALRDTSFKQQVVAVRAETKAQRDRVANLGLDPAEGGDAESVDVVLHDAEDQRTLRDAGFTWKVRIPDLAALERARAAADRAFAAATKRSALPSGRTEYRHLADVETELKTLAMQHPGLVKLITLNHKSLEGREVLGAEITKDVNVADGKPVFMQLGVHHAREWPSLEHVMEWAYELVGGYGKDARVTKLVDTSRAILVPVVNPDGFNLSREAPVDLGGPLAAIDLPPDVDSQLPVTDPTYTAALLADQNAGFFAFKRRNCRIKDGATPAPGECENSDNRLLGVDPNRNYGGLWGGPGASLDPTSDTYRGAAPFSEPETQNVRELMLSRHATVMITNHTFTGLVLYPPGVASLGPSVDDADFKALGDAMAAQNGYVSQPGYKLYDTTGTTEDWSYGATGGLGYTFEIGKDEFHPPYSEMIGEYEGPTELGGPGGNRAAYYLAHEWAAEAKRHSVLTGSAPKGTTLRLRKRFVSETSAVILDAEGTTGEPRTFEDRIDTVMRVGDDGRFAWHVNPSTRPAVARDRTVSGVAEKPATEQDISSPVPPLPTMPNATTFEVPAGATRQIRVQTIGTVPVDDIDVYLYKGSEIDPDNQVSSSAGGTADELVIYDNPAPGTYTVEVRNFAAVGPYDGTIQVYGAKAGTEKTIKAVTEAYTLSCETAEGKVFAERHVEVKRGQSVDVGGACAGTKASTPKLTVSLSVARRSLARALRSGLPVRVRCSAACTVGLTAQQGKTTVARAKARRISGRRTIVLRFSKSGKRRLSRRSSASLRVVAVARDRASRTASKRVRVTLR